MSRTKPSVWSPRGAAGVLIAVVGLSLPLAGCVAQGEPATSAPPSETAGSEPAATAAGSATPALVPDGTAEENKPFFDYLNQQVITATGNNPDGPAFINSLRAGGFPAEGMELTPDITTVGVKADSIQFSVHAADACIIGQWGSITGYTSITAAPISTGACLIGQTRPIDF